MCPTPIVVALEGNQVAGSERADSARLVFVSWDSERQVEVSVIQTWQTVVSDDVR